MTDIELTLLRIHILRFFLEDGAQQTYDLLQQPELQTYNAAWLRKLVYSLEWAGLLDKFGTTSGAFYMTSHLGYVALVTLREDLRHKPRGQPRSAVE